MEIDTEIASTVTTAEVNQDVIFDIDTGDADDDAASDSVEQISEDEAGDASAEAGSDAAAEAVSDTIDVLDEIP
jgi:hypothetical protein